MARGGRRIGGRDKPGDPAGPGGAEEGGFASDETGAPNLAAWGQEPLEARSPPPRSQNEPSLPDADVAEANGEDAYFNMTAGGRDEAADPPATAQQSSDGEAQAAAAARDHNDLQFYIDQISGGRITGWIQRGDMPSRRCVVVLKKGDETLARVTASRYRADLLSAGIGDGHHSFDLAIPESLFDEAEHLLDVIEEDTGFRLTTEPIRWRSAAASEAPGPRDTTPAARDEIRDNGAAHGFDPRELLESSVEE